MNVVEVLERCGGVADARTLVAFTSRRQVGHALEAGLVVRGARGCYALPGADEATAPRTVSRDLPAPDVWRDVLRPAATVIDCARTMPFDEALAIADSALRHGSVTGPDLLRRAEAVTTTGRRAALRVAREASALAANPFESVLRAISLDVPGLEVQPQVQLRDRGWRGRPDLVDEHLGLVIEAESFEFHGRRAALRRCGATASATPPWCCWGGRWCVSPGST